MKTACFIAIVCFGVFTAVPARAVEELPLARHKPLYSKQIVSPRDLLPHQLALAELATPIRDLRPAHAAACGNALCPSYIVLGTSY